MRGEADKRAGFNTCDLDSNPEEQPRLGQQREYAQIFLFQHLIHLSVIFPYPDLPPSLFPNDHPPSSFCITLIFFFPPCHNFLIFFLIPLHLSSLVPAVVFQKMFTISFMCSASIAFHFRLKLHKRPAEIRRTSIMRLLPLFLSIQIDS